MAGLGVLSDLVSDRSRPGRLGGCGVSRFLPVDVKAPDCRKNFATARSPFMALRRMCGEWSR